MNFNLTLDPEKSNVKSFGKTYSWPVWAYFAHFGVKNNFLEKSGCQFLDVTVVYHHGKIRN